MKNANGILMWIWNYDLNKELEKLSINYVSMEHYLFFVFLKFHISNVIKVESFHSVIALIIRKLCKKIYILFI